MIRVSNLGIKNNVIGNIKNNYQRMNKVQEQMSTGKKINRPSDHPIHAINSIYQRVRINQIDQYQKNIDDSKSHVDFSHDTISHAVNVMQRVRELTVQSANGTYNAKDREAMAYEIEELLKELIASANAKYKDHYLFSGSESEKMAFRMFETTREGLPRPVVDQVIYQGNNRVLKRAIDLEESVEVGVAGSNVFWAEPHIIVSRQDSRSYIAAQNQVVRIDGQSVQITQGDDLDTVIEKINREVSTVRAFKQRLPDGRVVFGIESNDPHLLMLEDIEGGTVLQDLAILRSGGDSAYPPNNIHPDTIQSGGSIFDAVIRFRNSLLTDDLENIGTRDLGSIDRGLHNLLKEQARISSSQTRMNLVEKKLARDKELSLIALSKNEDMDMAEAAVQYNQLANVHRVSLMSATKLIQPTLMDYMK